MSPSADVRNQKPDAHQSSRTLFAKSCRTPVQDQRGRFSLQTHTFLWSDGFDLYRSVSGPAEMEFFFEAISEITFHTSDGNREAILVEFLCNDIRCHRWIKKPISYDLADHLIGSAVVAFWSWFGLSIRSSLVLKLIQDLVVTLSRVAELLCRLPQDLSPSHWPSRAWQA